MRLLSYYARIYLSRIIYNAVTQKRLRRCHCSVGLCFSGWESIPKIAPHMAAYSNIGIIQFHFCCDLRLIINAFGLGEFLQHFFQIRDCICMLLVSYWLHAQEICMTFSPRFFSSTDLFVPRESAGSCFQTVFAPGRRSASPLRAMPLVAFRGEALPRPRKRAPAANGSNDGAPQQGNGVIENYDRGNAAKKKAPPVRRGARYRVRSEQRPEPTAASLDESVSKVGHPAANCGSVLWSTIACFGLCARPVNPCKWGRGQSEIYKKINVKVANRLKITGNNREGSPMSR
jgi:hypothetical protein